MAKLQTDTNGWVEISGNKLSKPGVFDYLGSEIGAPEPDRIYKVYRPEKELSNKETIDSFKLRPWIIDHTMLGKQFDDPDEKIHGVIGEDVYYDKKDKWLKGNIKIFSSDMEKEIGRGKNELSLGFKCTYEFGKTGTYEGQPWDVIQKDIRGNHVALVEDSRMDVAVMDHNGTAMDRKSTIKIINPMEKNSMEKEELIKAFQAFGTAMDAFLGGNTGLDGKAKDEEKDKAEDEEEKKAKDSEKEDKAKDSEGKAEDEEKKSEDCDKGEDEEKEEKGEDEDKDEKKSGMDANFIKKAIGEAISPLVNRISKLEKTGLDSKSFLAEIAKRDELAGRLSNHVGTFDHRKMSLQEVAEYGVKKLSIPCEAGSEMGGLEGYLHNRGGNQAVYSSGLDSTPASAANDLVDSFIKGE